MNKITCSYLLLFLFLLFVQVFCNRTEKNSYDMQWNMVKRIGKTFDVSNWVLYHDGTRKDSRWYKLWFDAMKNERSLGYFNVKFPQTSNSSNKNILTRQRKSSHHTTLHLYVRSYQQSLNDLIHSGLFSGIKSHQFRSDVLLVKISEESEVRRDFLDFMNGFKKDFNNKVFCYFLSENSSIKVFEMFKANPRTDFILKLYGVWDNQHWYQENQNELDSNPLSLRGAHLRVLSAYSPPFVTYIEDGCTSKDCFKGIFPNVFHALSDQMNFTFTIKRAYMWGSITNGTWNGMVGMLNDKIADIAATDLTITSARSTVVDFLPSLMETSESLYLKNPGDAFSSVAYIGSFTHFSWSAIVFWLILGPLILVGIVRNIKHRNKEDHTLFECCILVAASMVNLTYKIKSRIFRNRIAFISIVIGGMLIYYHWEAELYSHLAFKKTNLPFNNLKEFSENSKFKFAIAKGTAFVDFFRYSDDPVRKKIWKDKIEPFIDQMPIYEEIKDLIVDDPYTVTYLESSLRMTEEYLTCKIVDIKPPIRKPQLAFALQKDSQLFQAFSYHINNLKEVGLMQKYIKAHRIETQVCEDHSGEPVTIQQCYTAFQLLITGVALSFLGFILEVFIRPMRKRNIVNKVNSKIEKQIQNLEKIIEALQERIRQLELKKRE